MSHLKPFLLEKYSKVKSKGDDMMPIDSHVTNEKERRKLTSISQTANSKLQIQNFKKNFKKKTSKKSQC